MVSLLLGLKENSLAEYHRQRRPFFYLSGCLLPDSSLTYEINADKLTLFIPPVDPESVIWSGLPLTPEEALKLYDVDCVLPTAEVNSVLTSIASDYGDEAVAFAIAEQISETTIFH